MITLQLKPYNGEFPFSFSFLFTNHSDIEDIWLSHGWGPPNAAFANIET